MILDDFRDFINRARMGRRSVAGRSALSLLGGLGVGLGLMYLFDPSRGARRRALARDRATHLYHRASHLLDKASRDVRYRVQGLSAGARRLGRHEEHVPDDLLVQRVRSHMGRVVSHPHAVDVEARDGSITLSGLILAGDVPSLLACVAEVPGVSSIENHLEVHGEADGIPSLQGGHRRAGVRFELARDEWSPTTRIAMGALGASLVIAGLVKRRSLGLALAALGGGILLRDAGNRPLKRLVGVGAGRRAVDFHKTITVRAPIDDVFEFWMSFENFPRFMSHLRDVRPLGDGRYHWVAEGPAGIPVAWDAEVVELVPQRRLAWRSVPGAAIANAGVIHFESTPEGDTRLDIRMSYNPPAGAVGHVVASLFGTDPKHAMDEDLVRFQAILEQGKTTAHGEEVHFADLLGKG
jgi:uncharacterized membrane protein